MISVREASDIILSNLFQPKPVKVPIEEGVDRVLAEVVVADRDLPPFNRVTMDGLAIAFEGWRKGNRRFTIEAVQAAGEAAKKLSSVDKAVEVMTGAVLPEGTDTVIRYEDLKIESGVATVLNQEIEQGQSIHRQGQDVLKDDAVLSPGILLSPAEIALLASLGKEKVLVRAFPLTAIVASGDELVEISQQPLPHQIRRSNAYAIEAAMNSMCWEGKQYHFRDEKDSLKESLGELLRDYEVIILSGGVSQGKFDFIPEVMEALGVKKLFHQVRQRPGKPFWFGVSEGGTTIFALPGNPVSTYMCFYRYIKPWLLKSLGADEKPVSAVLATDFSFQPVLTYFLQVGVRNEEGKLMAYPAPGGGSGDFANLKNVDGFLELPPGRSEFRAGEVFPYLGFRH